MSGRLRIDWSALRAAAEQARARAYAPYSKFRVGAALLAADGRVIVGVNVENASYPLCVCAERNAIATAVVEGAKPIVAIAVVTGAARATPPCGGCRQVLAEHAPDALVRSYAGEDELRDTVRGLLPKSFDASFLAKPRRRG